MPHPVKGFAYVTKDCTYFFAFVKRFTEGIVDIGELVDGCVVWDKSRLHSRQYFVIANVVKQVLMYNFFQDLTQGFLDMFDFKR